MCPVNIGELKYRAIYVPHVVQMAGEPLLPTVTSEKILLFIIGFQTKDKERVQSILPWPPKFESKLSELT